MDNLQYICTEVCHENFIYCAKHTKWSKKHQERVSEVPLCNFKTAQDMATKITKNKNALTAAFTSRLLGD